MPNTHCSLNLGFLDTKYFQYSKFLLFVLTFPFFSLDLCSHSLLAQHFFTLSFAMMASEFCIHSLFHCQLCVPSIDMDFHQILSLTNCSSATEKYGSDRFYFISFCIQYIQHIHILILIVQKSPKLSALLLGARSKGGAAHR